MLLLFTSANADRPLYTRDLLNVCCDHHGATIQFGYRKKWVPPSLNYYLPAGSPELWTEYQSAMIIFCETLVRRRAGGRPVLRARRPARRRGRLAPAPAPAAVDLYTYHPVRLAKIVGARDEQDSVTFLLELRQFFDYGESWTADRQAEFQAYVKGSPEHPDGGLWVREDADLADGREAQPEPWRPTRADFSEEGWARLAAYMGRLKGLRGLTFFSVQHVNTFGGPPAPIFQRGPADPVRNRYDVKGGSRHRISLHVLEGGKADFRAPEMQIDAGVASVSGPFLRQRSYGMGADFEVSFKPSFQQEVRMLLLRVAPPSDSALKVLSPELQALVRVNVPWGKLLLAVALLAVGGIFAIISPGFIEELSKLLSGDDPHYWLQRHKVMVFTLTKIVALVSLGYGTYLGFNKLPFKGS